MIADRLSARLAGILLITAIAAGLANVALTEPLRAPDVLTAIATQATTVRLGALLQLVMGLAGAGIALALYPVLRRQHEGLALAAVAFRLMEAVVFGVAAAGLLTLVTLSQSATPAPAVVPLLITGHAWLSVVVATLAFCLGALFYYAIMYQARLVPRWLAGFGLLAIVLYTSASLLALFGTPPMSPILLILDLPTLVQELVLAGWLIIKGFAPTPRQLAAAGVGGTAAAPPGIATAGSR